MKFKVVVIIVLFLILVSAFTVSIAGSERLSIESKTLSLGEEARIIIMLDSVPNGLSGYRITVSLENGDIGDIVEVEFPEWAKALSESSTLPSDSVTLRAVDLQDKVRIGATNIEIATLVFKATKQGESLIKLSVNSMDDDKGDPINPLIEHGRVKVTGETATTQETLTVTTTLTTTVTGTYIYTTMVVVVERTVDIYSSVLTIVIVSSMVVIAVLSIMILKRMGRRKPRVVSVQ